jgi:glycosyltransferase involved in cell wall biosynthesis
MAGPLKIVVLVPCYNHGLTVGHVVNQARRFFPVIAVNDGSTDSTAAVLSREEDIECLTFPENLGKAAALEAGFNKARKLGFSHAITIDADGQHPVEELPAFAESAKANSSAIVVGVRDLKAANAPFHRRISNTLSSVLFRFETGLPLADTQCGFRVYPLAAIAALRPKADRYAYELELLVRAAWSGIPLFPCPVTVDYSAPTSRLSHFHPTLDFLRAVRVHARLAAESLLRPPTPKSKQ